MVCEWYNKPRDIGNSKMYDSPGVLELSLIVGVSFYGASRSKIFQLLGSST